MRDLRSYIGRLREPGVSAYLDFVVAGASLKSQCLYFVLDNVFCVHSDQMSDPSHWG